MRQAIGTVHLQQRLPWRVAGGHASAQLSAAGWWALPYAIIWGAALSLISSTTQRAQCVGFCAVYAGWVTYAVLLAAVLLSALVAVGELFLLSR